MPTTYAIPDGRTVMAATLYNGTGASQSINNSNNGVSFQPDFVWAKSRSNAYPNVLVNSIVGATKYLVSNNTDAETTDAGYIASINSNGFSVGSSGGLNVSGGTFVGWQWKAGGTAVSNTNGSITSSVSANTTAGFSVVTYTGNGVANATIGHGLGVTPQMVIVKQRNSGNDWPVYHASLSSPNNLWLDLTVSASTYTGRFNYAGFSSSVFSVSSQGEANGNTSTYVAYCFAAVAGYSAFGSYVGNGTQGAGPFVYTGFRPRYVLIKNINGAYDWHCYDSSRSPYNYSGSNILKPNTSDAELTGRNDVQIDFLSNGFRLIGNDIGINQSGSTHIYMTFAEVPFKFANAR